MKPNKIGVTSDGSVAVTVSSKVENAVWKAVKLAIKEGWTPRQLKLEVAEAWSEQSPRLIRGEDATEDAMAAADKAVRAAFWEENNK